MLKLNFKSKSKKRKSDERGLALVEAIPVLFMIIVIFNFSLGFFGAIHSGILNSIGAYNYTIETFRFRSNLMYFRPGSNLKSHYLQSKNRVHGIIQDGNSLADTKGAPWPVTVRTVAFAAGATGLKKDSEGSANDHQFKRKDDPTNVWKYDSNYAPSSNAATNIPEIWIKTVYGICLNADCK